MQPSIPHFQHVVSRILANSWFSEAVLPGKQEFTFSLDESGARISEVPQEPFESLLLHVRRLTMNDSAENILSLRKMLNGVAKSAQDRNLLDTWFKYWRLALAKEPFTLTRSDGTSEIITPYRVYDTFINGHHFHSNSGAYNLVLYGQPSPIAFRPDLFLQNVFHNAVCQIAFAAIGLSRFIDAGFTFTDIPILGAGVIDKGVVLDFVWYRNRVSDLDEQFKVFRDWIDQNGGTGSRTAKFYWT